MELKFKGTPGAWVEEDCAVYAENGSDIAAVYDGLPTSIIDMDKEVAQANTKLIAAAPELLEVCVKLCAFCTEVAAMSQTGDKSGAEEVGIKLGNLYGDAYEAIMKALDE